MTTYRTIYDGLRTLLAGVPNLRPSALTYNQMGGEPTGSDHRVFGLRVDSIAALPSGRQQLRTVSVSVRLVHAVRRAAHDDDVGLSYDDIYAVEQALCSQFEWGSVRAITWAQSQTQSGEHVVSDGSFDVTVDTFTRGSA